MDRRGRPRASSCKTCKIELNQTEVQVASLQVQIATVKAVAALRKSINTLPEVEAELLRLNRDYNVTKTEYERLYEKAGAGNAVRCRGSGR